MVQEVLSRVRENGYVYEGTYEGWYCPRCADFKAENEIDEGNRCPIHHIELTREQEENYFFALSAFQERLEELYAERDGLRRAAHPLQRGAVVHPLGPARRAADAAQADAGACRCRGTSEHVFYVWFDALLNYYTALSYAPAPAGATSATASSSALLAGRATT